MRYDNSFMNKVLELSVPLIYVTEKTKMVTDQNVSPRKYKIVMAR